MNSTLKPSDYIDAIEKKLKSWNLGSVLFNPTFDSDDNELAELKFPAVLIYVNELGETIRSKQGTGQLSEPFDVELICIYPTSEDDADKKIINFAAFVKRKVMKNTWGLSGVHPPTKIKALDMTNGIEGHQQWRVNFEQIVDFGTIEDEKEITDIQLYMGINPKSDDDFKRVEINERS